MSDFDVTAIDWEKVSGLAPTIVQHARTLQVLMLAYSTPESLRATTASQFVNFYSRSKKRLWMKGETSGNRLKLVDIQSDCDSDAILIRALPEGPTCHRETTSCFGTESSPGLGFLAQLAGLIAERAKAAPTAEMDKPSYVAKLLGEGLDRVAQKVGEEAVETVIAAKNSDLAKFEGEAADLIFHTLVLLEAKGSSLAAVVEVLRQRSR